MEQTWQSYEEVAAFLLNKFSSHFGLIGVEGKQSIPGLKSGTSWEIDAKGFRENNIGFVIVECRHYTTSKQNQEKIGGLAYRISDTGAFGGILVSPLGFQAGAALVAKAENILSVILDEKSTPTEFSIQFLNKIFVGLEDHVDATDTLEVNIVRRCMKCKNEFVVENEEQICISCSKSHST